MSILHPQPRRAAAPRDDFASVRRTSLFRVKVDWWR